ncbi:MAG: cytochrome c [Gammaproteobacteria bacterium]
MKYLLVFSTAVALACVSISTLAASPRTNYLLYCSGCHRPDGHGKPPNVPTLHHELGRMMTVPQMRAYLVQVPGSSQAPLTDAELTSVINWVLTEFNASTLPPGFEPLSAAEVTAARKDVLADPLKYRIQYWQDYDFSD